MDQPLTSAAPFDYDDETAALIFKLQLDDIDELLEKSKVKGKVKEGSITDQEVALQLERAQLERNAMILLDRSMSKSIARAVLHDADLIAHMQTQEIQAAVDRVIALRFAGDDAEAQSDIASQPPSSPVAVILDDELIEKLSAIYHETPEEDSDHNALVKRVGPNLPDQNGESSTWAATRKVESRRCVICEEHVAFFDVARLPCQHECCRACLMEMFEAATVDESRYPPKCCDEISPESENVRLFLTSEMIEKYLEKKIEWETKNRTYCSNKDCRKFIASEHIFADLAVCPTCDHKTCTLCKEAFHDADCPKDNELEQTLELVKENSWRRCESCRRILDLMVGCNHITLVFPFEEVDAFADYDRCPCSAEFCYVCGLKWKTCKCPLWDESRLLLRANEVVDRGGNIDAVAQVQARAGCYHEGFRMLPEAGRCQDCGNYMHNFILECRRCPLRVCRRCRRDRG